MVIGWWMDKRRTGPVPAVQVIWPLLLDLVMIGLFAMLLMGWMVSSAYAEPPRTGAIVWVPLFGGLLMASVSLSLTLVTAVRAALRR